jgi:hypothetical protein
MSRGGPRFRSPPQMSMPTSPVTRDKRVIMPTVAGATQSKDIRDMGTAFFREFLEEASKGDVSQGRCIAAVGIGHGLISELDRIRQVTDDMVMRAQQAYQAATGRDLEAQLARAILQAVLTPPGAISTSEPV